jgi:hypothetical protein
MRTRPLIGLVALLALAAGCGSGSKTGHEDAAGPAVPWTASQPPQVLDRTPVATPCRASDLSVVGQVKFTPWLSGGMALVNLRNSGTHACRLSGRPAMRFVHRGGPVQVQTRIPQLPMNFPQATYPPSSLLALRPGDPASVTVRWNNWCDPVVKGRPHVPPSALRITLPHGRGHLDANYNAVVPCLSPDSPTTIGVSSFQGAIIRVPQPWSYGVLRASLPGPTVHAHRGGILRFPILLRNASQTTVRFDPCPAYEEQLVPTGKVQVYDLNCRDAHPIAPGKELEFTMELRVPKNAPVGPNGLFWGLDPFGDQDPQAHGRVIIDR